MKLKYLQAGAHTFKQKDNQADATMYGQKV